MSDLGSVLEPGDPASIGNWSLTRRLGVGGMGVVYLGHNESGQKAAVKAVHPWLASDPSFRARFRREVAISSTVIGPHVASILDSDSEASRPWYAMTFVEGMSVQDEIAAQGPLSGPDLRRVATLLLDALASIHAVGVIHRDLKPANIIMSDGVPVLVDFGLSHVTEGTAITATSQVLGSAGWMAPEQVLGEATTPESDIFSWGACIAFAATARPPFGTGKPEALAFRLVHHPPDLAGVVPDMEVVLQRALAKDPRWRPTITELHAALSADSSTAMTMPQHPPTVPLTISGSEWLPVTPDLPTGRSRRSPIGIAFASVIALALLSIGGVVLAMALNRPTPEAEEPPAYVETSTTPSPPAADDISPDLISPDLQATVEPTIPIAAYGAVEIGMSGAELRQTGAVREDQWTTGPDGIGCWSLQLAGTAGSVGYDGNLDEVFAIHFGYDMETSEGLRLGLTEAQVREIYPDLGYEQHGFLAAPVTTSASYIIGINFDSGLVDQLVLNADDQRCYG